MGRLGQYGLLARSRWWALYETLMQMPGLRVKGPGSGARGELL